LILARFKDLLIRQWIDDRLLLLGSLTKGAKTPDCDSWNFEPLKRTHYVV
jgi:hypothetical protein